jgi:hypothetical protein
VRHPRTHDRLGRGRTQPGAFVEEWHQITGDSFIVDVRPIVGDPAEGFMEVFKYAVKFSDQPVAELHGTPSDALKGKRLLGSAGCFRGVEVPEELKTSCLMICLMSICSIDFCGVGYRLSPANRSLRRSRRGISGGSLA